MTKTLSIALLFVCGYSYAQKGGYLLTNSNGAISIGTDVNTAPLTVANFSTSFPAPQIGTIVHLVSSGTDINPRVSFDDYNGANVLGGVFQGRRAGGSAASPTPALSDYTLVALVGDGYGVDSFTNAGIGAVTIKAGGTFTNTSKPTYISFLTTPSASTTPVERMRIKSNGQIQINSLTEGIVVTDGTGNVSVISGTASQVLRRNAGNTAYEFATIGGTGTVTDVSVVSANGFAGTVATSTSTPAITLSTSITGILKGNGTAISAASAGTDYLAPSGNGSALTGLTASQVGLGNVTNESKATMFTSPAFTGTATGIGIPVYAQVTGSNATTTGQALVNITGLSVALTTNATYEFEAVMSVSTSAVTTGTAYGVNYSVAGGTVEAHIIGASTSTATKTLRISAFNSATSLYLATSAQTGGILIKGRVTTGANAGNLTVSHLKLTSGTSTVFIGSFLKVTRIN